MPAVPQTANLDLWLPPDDYESIPNWGELLNQNWAILDQQVPSVDAPLTPDRLNINDDVSWNDHEIIDLGALTFSPQGASDTDANKLYDVLGDLYFNDGNGNTIRFTEDGLIIYADGPSAAPTMGANWTNNGIAFWKDAGGYVHMQGTAEANASAATTILTLPAGYRPANNQFFIIPRLPTAGAEVVTMQTNGILLLPAPTAGQTYGLTQISFKAA